MVPLTQALVQIALKTSWSYVALSPAWLSKASTSRPTSLPLGSSAQKLMVPESLRRTCPGPRRTAVQTVTPIIILCGSTYRLMTSSCPKPLSKQKTLVCWSRKWAVSCKVVSNWWALTKRIMRSQTGASWPKGRISKATVLSWSPVIIRPFSLIAWMWSCQPSNKTTFWPASAIW